MAAGVAGSEPRPLGELLELLAWRRRDFESLAEWLRAEIDATRCVPTLEAYDILDHLLTYGHFSDEPVYLADLTSKRIPYVYPEQTTSPWS